MLNFTMREYVSPMKPTYIQSIYQIAHQKIYVGLIHFPSQSFTLYGSNNIPIINSPYVDHV